MKLALSGTLLSNSLKPECQDIPGQKFDSRMRGNEGGESGKFILG